VTDCTHRPLAEQVPLRQGPADAQELPAFATTSHTPAALQIMLAHSVEGPQALPVNGLAWHWPAWHTPALQGLAPPLGAQGLPSAMATAEHWPLASHWPAVHGLPVAQAWPMLGLVTHWPGAAPHSPALHGLDWAQVLPLTLLPPKHGAPGSPAKTH
jgi:hypothetical protein